VLGSRFWVGAALAGQRGPTRVLVAYFPSAGRTWDGGEGVDLDAGDFGLEGSDRAPSRDHAGSISTASLFVRRSRTP
jgi:hypothetical protein